MTKTMFAFWVFLLTGFFLVCGCSTPIDTSPSHTRILNPDQDDKMGGSFIESSDIRTIAQQFSTDLLSLPEINQNPDVSYIVTQRIRNSTRYMVDTELLMRRLRLELNQYGKGQVRFLAQDSGQAARTQILREREQSLIHEAIDEIAIYIANSEIVQKSPSSLRVDILPVANTNLFNMNADSFASLLRTKIKDHAGDKILFAGPNTRPTEVDYTLTGEFFAQSLKTEGIASTVEDLKWAQENPEQFYDVDKTDGQATVYGTQVNIGVPHRRVKIGPNTTYKIIDPSLWHSPNVTKTFNVMLVNHEQFAVLEKTVNLEERISTGSERANFILTGDISALSKASDGARSDYVLIGLYLIDPVTNDMLWEYGYEVKRVTSRSVLYR